MAINIKNLEEIIQKKAFSASPTTPVSDLSNIVEMALLSTNSIVEYDSSGALPTASASNIKLAYVKSDRSLRLNTGTKWNSMASGGAQAGSEGVPFSIQGSTSAYTLGGASPGSVNTIDKFSLTSDADATDVGDLATTRQYNTGGKSSSNAYTSGSASPAYVNTTEKMPFASEGNAVAVPTMTLVNTIGSANLEDISPSAGDYMYIASGKQSAPTFNDVIDKASTSSETAFANVGNVFLPGYQGRAGHSSGTYGYLSGTQFYTNNIEKFSLTSDGDGTDVGNLLTVKGFSTGSSSPTYGYNSGGYSPAAAGSTNVIEKFSFSSDGNSTDVGDLLASPTSSWRNSSGGHSSPTYGYHSGGTSPAADDTIQKYSFSSDGNSTDVGNLTVARGAGAGVAK